MCIRDSDKLGDLILTLPALKIIKASIPDIQIDLLVDDKFSDIHQITEIIDNVICPQDDLVSKIAARDYDYSISFFSTFNTGYKLWKSNIKKRYAPATKLAQIFYNKKIEQNRSSSIKSEYEYNNDMAKFFLKDPVIYQIETFPPNHHPYVPLVITYYYTSLHVYILSLIHI